MASVSDTLFANLTKEVIKMADYVKTPGARVAARLSFGGNIMTITKEWDGTTYTIDSGDTIATFKDVWHGTIDDQYNSCSPYKYADDANRVLADSIIERQTGRMALGYLISLSGGLYVPSASGAKHEVLLSGKKITFMWGEYIVTRVMKR